MSTYFPWLVTTDASGNTKLNVSGIIATLLMVLIAVWVLKKLPVTKKIV